MKLSMVRERLFKGVQITSKIISARSNLPVLSNLLFTAEDNTLKIESSNLEISIRLKVGAKVEEPGQITVPARKFLDYLASLKGEQVQLELDKKQIVVHADADEARFVTMPADEFPTLPQPSEKKAQVLIPQDEFRHAVKQTAFAAAPGETHPVLAGVYFDLAEEGSLKMVATDSFRLSLRKLNLQSALTKSFIVPATALVEMEHLIGEGEEDAKTHVQLELSESDNQVFFYYGEIELISRLLEAEFPDYQKVFPVSFVTQVNLNRSLMVEALRRTSIFAAREGQAVKVQFTPESGEIKLSAQSVEVGSHIGQLSAEMEGEAVELGFNSRYLLDGLNSFQGEMVKFSISGANSPVLITVPDRPDYQHIVMPMSVNN